MTITVDIHLAAEYANQSLADDVRRGLGSVAKQLPPKWFYDDLGSQLFDEITRLPEYYQTRAERSILDANAKRIASLTGADTLVELGSGTSEKTRLLLTALHDAGLLTTFIPFDVSEQTLRDAARAIDVEYQGVNVHAIVGDFDHHLAKIPVGGRKLIAFLGGTIGNFTPPARRRFLQQLTSVMEPGDHLLLGTDLVKSPDRLVAAYDDAAGVTEAFNKNVLTVMNRELDADFNRGDFDHHAIWDSHESWIEMRLRARRTHQVTIPALDMCVTFAEGEEILTEISAKFTESAVQAELAAAGLTLRNWWTDTPGDFALSLSEFSLSP